jgi:uncharacterized membrane protein
VAAIPSMNALDPRRSMIVGILLGIGLMAAVDEIVFHQLLGWHHFFDWSTPAFGLFSDGLLHAGELILIVLGFFMLADLRARRALARAHVRAGLFLGAGGFQVLDGTLHHKVLGIHQIRYVDNVLPYDLAWNAFGLALLVIGFVLLRRARRNTAASATARAR